MSRRIPFIAQYIALAKILREVLRALDFDALTLRLRCDDPRRLGFPVPYRSSATSFGGNFCLPAIMLFCGAFVRCLEYIVFVGLFSLHFNKISIDKMAKK